MHLTTNFKKLLVWMTGYVHIVAFILTGGYLFVKDDNPQIKATCKEATYFTFVFFFIGLFNTLIKEFIILAGGSLTGFNIYLTVISILKILTFVTLLLLDLFGINLIHTPLGVRVQADDVIIPAIDDNESSSNETEEDDEEDFVDEDGNVYQNNIFGE